MFVLLVFTKHIYLQRTKQAVKKARLSAALKALVKFNSLLDCFLFLGTEAVGLSPRGGIFSGH